MKVCDRCKKQIDKAKICFEFELCDDCANHIREWIKKGEKKGLLDLGLETIYKRRNR